VFHGMMPHVHLYTLVLIQLYNLRISKGGSITVTIIIVTPDPVFHKPIYSMNQYIINQLIKLTIENPRT
jgi:hypothetical protein